MGLWEEVKEAIIENQGDISGIQSIPQHIKDVYKTSFTTSPYAYIEVAARAQKWVDQALSRNMYLETRDIDETMKIYNTAWEKGVKSTYYLHMKPRHTAEQSTTNVNKAVKMGKVGFGALNFASSPAFSAPLQKSLDIEPKPTYFVAPIVPEKAPTPVFTNKELVQDDLVSSAQSIIREEVVKKEEVIVAKSSRNEYTSLSSLSQTASPLEDPAEDEGNVCISCQ